MALDQSRLVPEDQDLFYKGGPFDETEARSLISIMPPEAKKTLYRSPAFYFKLPEHELQRQIKPTPRLNQIRMAFWREYDAAQSAMGKMTLKGIISFLGNLPTFYVREALTTPNQLAWVLCPPVSYENTLEEALQRGLQRVNEILDISLHDEDGRFDKGRAELLLKAVAFLDVRKHGMPTQRIQQHQIQEVSVTRRDAKQLGGARVEDLDQKIKRLEAALHAEESTEPLKIPEVVD